MALTRRMSGRVEERTESSAADDIADIAGATCRHVGAQSEEADSFGGDLQAALGLGRSVLGSS